MRDLPELPFDPSGDWDAALTAMLQARARQTQNDADVLPLREPVSELTDVPGPPLLWDEPERPLMESSVADSDLGLVASGMVSFVGRGEPCAPIGELCPDCPRVGCVGLILARRLGEVLVHWIDSLPAVSWESEAHVAPMTAQEWLDVWSSLRSGTTTPVVHARTGNWCIGFVCNGCGDAKTLSLPEAPILDDPSGLLRQHGYRFVRDLGFLCQGCQAQL